ncbi:MAG: hypothetical protein JXA92_08905 [candidate division Zixibacteria bacterium]|nr:hypothetical protein [candidate division Zixibacteria bacterium]
MISLFIFGCIGLPGYVYNISNTKIELTVKQLVVEKSEYFKNPFTFMIIVDSSPCGKMLTETIWWADWQKHMIERDIGFVIATSRADSMDVVIAADLDNVKAPVLVLPSCEKYVSELDPFPGIVPLKILTDSTGTVIYGKVYIPDTAASNKMISKIDSLINSKITVSAK